MELLQHGRRRSADVVAAAAEALISTLNTSAEAPGLHGTEAPGLHGTKDSPMEAYAATSSLEAPTPAPKVATTGAVTSPGALDLGSSTSRMPTTRAAPPAPVDLSGPRSETIAIMLAMQRSGTNFLAVELSRHPCIDFQHELFNDLKLKTLGLKRVQEVSEALLSTLLLVKRRFWSHGANPFEIKKYLTPRSHKFTMRRDSDCGVRMDFQFCLPDPTFSDHLLYSPSFQQDWRCGGTTTVTGSGREEQQLCCHSFICWHALILQDTEIHALLLRGLKTSQGSGPAGRFPLDSQRKWLSTPIHPSSARYYSSKLYNDASACFPTTTKPQM